MANWTSWRKIADSGGWYDEQFDYEGPACYELGVGPTSTRVSPKYVGETSNERARMSQYASGSSHLEKEIAHYLGRRYNLYYRGIACSSKKEAKEMQDNLLDRYVYDWNVAGNIDD